MPDGRYPGGFSRREFFFRAWARSHNMSIRAAKADPAAQGYYSEAYGRGRSLAARAWAYAGVIEQDPGTGDWGYVEEYA